MCQSHLQRVHLVCWNADAIKSDRMIYQTIAVSVVIIWREQCTHCIQGFASQSWNEGDIDLRLAASVRQPWWLEIDLLKGHCDASHIACRSPGHWHQSWPNSQSKQMQLTVHTHRRVFSNVTCRWLMRLRQRLELLQHDEGLFTASLHVNDQCMLIIKVISNYVPWDIMIIFRNIPPSAAKMVLPCLNSM